MIDIDQANAVLQQAAVEDRGRMPNLSTVRRRDPLAAANARLVELVEERRHRAMGIRSDEHAT